MTKKTPKQEVETAIAHLQLARGKYILEGKEDEAAKILVQIEALKAGL